MKAFLLALTLITGSYAHAGRESHGFQAFETVSCVSDKHDIQFRKNPDGTGSVKIDGQDVECARVVDGNLPDADTMNVTMACVQKKGFSVLLEENREQAAVTLYEADADENLEPVAMIDCKK